MKQTLQNRIQILSSNIKILHQLRTRETNEPCNNTRNQLYVLYKTL